MHDLGITEFDPAEVLTNPARIAAYIQIVADENPDDSRAIVRALGVAVRAHGSPAIVAAEAGMRVQDLDAALAGDISFEAVLKIARAVGVRLYFSR